MRHIQDPALGTVIRDLLEAHHDASVQNRVHWTVTGFEQAADAMGFLDGKHPYRAVHSRNGSARCLMNANGESCTFALVVTDNGMARESETARQRAFKSIDGEILTEKNHMRALFKNRGLHPDKFRRYDRLTRATAVITT